MASQLTTTAIMTRKVIRYGLVGFFVFLGVRAVFLSAYKAYIASLPVKIPPATLGFDVLPPVNFPKQKTELPELEYRVETASGFLPEFLTQAKVYAFLPLTADLFSYDNMRESASVFGFSRKPIEIGLRGFQFIHPTVPATMNSDVVTKTFSLSYNLAADSSARQNRSKTVLEAKSIILKKLADANSLPEDLENGVIGDIFLKVEGQNLVRALALSDAKLVQISFFRKNIGRIEDRDGVVEEGVPVVTADQNKANVWFIISGSGDRDKQIIAGEYKYFPVDYNLVETYPIKTAEDALKDLVDGKGYIANLGFNLDGNIAIDEIYLAYFDPNEPSSFLQPVIVFKGRDDFLAYVPAVANEFIERPEE